MKIWIDLANAPHVGFFLPIIRRLRAAGHEVMITLRDFNHTVEIAQVFEHAGEIYMRTQTTSEMNAVNISTGMALFLYADIPVLVYPNASLYLEGRHHNA